jgi:MFS family permease
LTAERLAPSHLRGSYFGALSLSGLGFAVGPFAGGALLELAGGPWTFLMTVAAIAASIDVVVVTRRSQSALTRR